MVINNNLYNPQSYLELVTGECYFIKGFDDVAFIEEVIENETDYCLWNYPLNEIDHIVENEVNVVLVECYKYVDGVQTQELRWFEVPEEVMEEC